MNEVGTRDDLDRRIVLESIARQQEYADVLSAKPYSERAFAAYQCTRAVLRAMAHVQPEFSEEINRLVDTLDDAFTKVGRTQQ